MICTVIDCVGPCKSTQWPKYLFGTASIICIRHCVSRWWRIYPPHGNCSSLNPWWNESHIELIFHFLGGCLSISFFLIFFARPKGGFLKSHSRRGSLYAEDFSFFERKSFSFLGCYYRSALDRETLVVRSSSKSIDELCPSPPRHFISSVFCDCHDGFEMSNKKMEESGVIGHFGWVDWRFFSIKTSV